MVSTCDEHSRSFRGGLGASLQGDERDLSALVRLAEGGHCDIFGELFAQLLNDHHAVVIAVMVAQARNEQFVLNFVAKLLALTHFLSQRLLPVNVLLAVGVALHLHYQFFYFSQVAVRIGHASKQSHSCGPSAHC